MRIAIIGSRNYQDLDRVIEFVRNLDHDTEVVSGGARGVDRTAAEAARARGLKVTELPPEYSRYGGHKAPAIRNQQIVAYCDSLVAFWDGKSRGTAHVVSLARQAGKLAKVHR